MHAEQKVRIGYVLKMYPRFSETFIVTEILAREARGADLRIYSMRPPADPRFHGALGRVQAPVSYLSRPRTAESLWEILRGAERLPGFVAALPELLTAEASDAAQAVDVAGRALDDGITHLHAHFASMATTIARLASLLTGIPYSFTAHAKDLFHESVDPLDVDRKVRDAHHVVTVSDFNVRHLAQTAPSAASTPVVRVYNGIDTEAFPFRTRAAVAGAPEVIAVGRLVEKKGFRYLVEAVAHLRRGGRDVSCRIVGGGALEGELSELARRLGVADLVTLAGPMPQEDIRNEVAAARVFAAPCVVGSDGNADGLPTVLLETMALGTPCISTDVTGIVEAVRSGETGLRVEQHDAPGLAAAIASLLDDPARGERLAAAARALVEREFASTRQAQQLEELVQAPAERELAEVA
ncbi:glycosyltransferase [Microbacterium sp. G2-8]|uniref:glycosyltransferase n=1 Tax=Microbacterium sp. G2-8 TaxID=2842454 RepID=UPI001C88EF2A|nr:glycosyltransferase [Microbacterium sp. G2-8]